MADFTQESPLKLNIRQLQTLMNRGADCLLKALVIVNIMFLNYRRRILQLHALEACEQGSYERNAPLDVPRASRIQRLQEKVMFISQLFSRRKKEEALRVNV